jgi:enoyl-CoA hydratase/carnithine racemase
MDTPQFKRTKMSRSGRTAVLSLASDKVNALDREVLQEISRFVAFCEQDPVVGALVITGEGSVFSAGLNVNVLLGNER